MLVSPWLINMNLGALRTIIPSGNARLPFKSLLYVHICTVSLLLERMSLIYQLV